MFRKLWRILCAAMHVVDVITPITPRPIDVTISAVKEAVRLAEGLGRGQGERKRKFANDMTVSLLCVINGSKPQDDLGPLIDAMVAYENAKRGK